jgi:hypothetical protein
MEAALVVISLASPIYLIVRWELERREHPSYLRQHGIVIVSENALQGHSASIGEYRGQPIWASVRFKGMNYRFARIIDRSKRELVGPRELFLEPGLVYITN